MFTNNIEFKNFNIKLKKSNKIRYLFNKLLKENNEILKSFSSSYKDSYSKKIVSKLNKVSQIILIGMGGSSLGSRSIYSFLKKKINKVFYFKDNLEITKFDLKTNNKKKLNIIISKSGNTLETIFNSNILIKKTSKNIFITENKQSYLFDLAKKLKSEIIYHNNFIGGRYSVLSEVGMLPAELMGLNPRKFRRFNLLIKNKVFINSLIQNVANILYLIKKKKFNSIILNYDDQSEDFFLWYQQLVAESIGKKNKGILPIISTMPKDNHSLLQLYLDGFKNNFFTFFFVKDGLSPKVNEKELLKTHHYLRDKNLTNIKEAQFKATKKVFGEKNIPFRSFIINKRDEKSMGELFVFFMLETILLGKALKLNPYDQPAVELIKKETKKFLINS